MYCASAQNVVMAEGNFEWDDLGSWTALARHLKADAEGNCAVGEFVHVEPDAFPADFAADLPKPIAHFMAISQVRPRDDPASHLAARCRWASNTPADYRGPPPGVL